MLSTFRPDGGGWSPLKTTTDPFYQFGYSGTITIVRLVTVVDGITVHAEEPVPAVP